MVDEDDFAAMFEASVKGGSHRDPSLKPGMRVRGTLIAITGDTAFVDIGSRREAELARSELLDAKGVLQFAVGDAIDATIVRADGRGPALLKVALGGAELLTSELELALESGTPVEGQFTRAVKAGIEVDLGGRRAFCPASQVDLIYVADLETFVGQRHFFRVLEVRDGGRSIVVSRKAILETEREAQARALLDNLDAGAQIDGIVQSLQPYGAFVDLGGVQGMVHVSEISHRRVSHPSDAVQVGDRVHVQVLSVESRPKGPPKIALSMKALTQPDPTEQAAESEVVTGTVVKVEGFGVLVSTKIGDGMVPNAELGLPPGSDPRRAFEIGAELQVVLKNRDSQGRLRFSRKAVEQVEERQAFAAFRSEGGSKASLGSLGDLLRGINLEGKGRAG